MKLDHIGIAVRSLEKSLAFYRDSLGIDAAGTETIEAEKVRVAMLPLGDTRIELLEPTEDGSAVGKFIAKQGEGIHHIAIAVTNFDADLQRLTEQGVRVLRGKREYGAGGHRYAFLHPSSCGGVLIELVEALPKE